MRSFGAQTSLAAGDGSARKRAFSALVASWGFGLGAAVLAWVSGCNEGGGDPQHTDTTTAMMQTSTTTTSETTTTSTTTTTTSTSTQSDAGAAYWDSFRWDKEKWQ